MPVEVRPSSENNSRNDFGSLHGCFVEGSTEQRTRERLRRRRALVISVFAQTALLTGIVLAPLFAKPARIDAPVFIPIPPYSPSHAPRRNDTVVRANPNQPRNLCATCYSPKFPDHPATTDNPRPDDSPNEFLPSDGRQNPTNGWGIIGVDDGRRQPLPPENSNRTPKRVVMTHLEPAMLIQRVEPSYPTLMRQIRRSGRVELRAIIATDGSIQSLQVVSGDPGFVQSALDAVRQWRYHPTVLNGQPVEIDTFITVTYQLQQ